MNSLARFARLNSCLVILVAHPRKMNKQYGTQKTEVPTMYDINGSANFFNMTDYGIVVDRQDEWGSCIYTSRKPVSVISEQRETQRSATM